VKRLRTASTARLITIATVIVVVLVGSAIAVASTGSSGSTPPPKPLDQAIHDALSAPKPEGVTARITFTNNLFPSGALAGQAGSALMSGASGRLWLNDSGGRIELQSDAGDVQVVWDDSKVTVYDASSNTAYIADLPAQSSSSGTDTHTPPTLDQISSFLTDLEKHWDVSDAVPSNVGGQEAYTVTVSPSHDGGLLGKAELAWDAVHGVPLKVAVYAQGSTAPALALEVNDISFGPVATSDVAVSPPAGAKTVDLSSQASGTSGDAESAPVTGLAAVQAAAPFTVTAPDTLVGLPRQDIRLVGPSDSRSAIVVYGEGLGAIVVVERAKDTTSGGKPGGSSALDSLPSVSLDGVTAHELSTQLGTVLGWDNGDVSYILAGSVPSAAAEAAARALK
jgi:outer membrane lipoprotein-sorting protein